jgi:hypothetical protein
MTMTTSRRPRQSLRQIFLAPAIIGVLSGIGLIAALVGDGVWDGLSWVTLLVPIVLYAGFLAIGRCRRA